MSWGEIKKAVNGLIGTSDFEPLDEVIVGQKSLSASDNLYYTFWSGNKQFTQVEEFEIPVKFKMRNAGTLKIRLSKSGSIGSGKYYNSYVYKNGVQVFLKENTLDPAFTSDAITVNKGDTISVKVFCTQYSLHNLALISCEILADLIDTTPIKLI